MSDILRKLFSGSKACPRCKTCHPDGQCEKPAKENACEKCALPSSDMRNDVYSECDCQNLDKEWARQPKKGMEDMRAKCTHGVPYEDCKVCIPMVAQPDDEMLEIVPVNEEIQEQMDKVMEAWDKKKADDEMLEMTDQEGAEALAFAQMLPCQDQETSRKLRRYIKSFILDRYALLRREKRLQDENETIAIENSKYMEGLERIEDMKCIQHMPSCSDIAHAVLRDVSKSRE